MRGDFDSADYSVVVKLRARPPRPWRWEIYRAGKRQPVERSESFFAMRGDAQASGKAALARLIDSLNSSSRP